jgi:hypothetical protein
MLVSLKPFKPTHPVGHLIRWMHVPAGRAQFLVSWL